jgi:hypothetical protein
MTKRKGQNDTQTVVDKYDLILIWFIVLNATLCNISAISWWPVLVVEESEVPGVNQWPWASNWWTLSLAATSRMHLFCNLQSRAGTHTVLVTGLYEFLGNPTT